MSYGFDMAFKAVESEADVLNIINNFSKWLMKPQNAKALIQRNIFYSPCFRFKNINPEDEIISWSTKWWLNRLFTASFVYWPKHNLLGLAGNYELAKEGEEGNGFNEPIYFQNSTDRNYEISTWGDYCPLFQKAIDDCKKLTTAEAYKLIGWDWELEERTEEELKAPANEYLYCSSVYETIFNELKLEDWLYDAEDEDFIRIKVNTLQTDAQEIKLKTVAIRAAIEEQKRIYKT